MGWLSFNPRTAYAAARHPANQVSERRLDRLDADLVPGSDELVEDFRELLAAGDERRVGESLEVAVALDAVGGGGGEEPNGKRLLPREAADGDGELGEGLVRDAAVGVHAAVVGVGDNEVLHVRGLTIFADLGVVVRGARVEHVAQSTALDRGSEDARSDQPAVLVDRKLLHPLTQADAEHVREALVERARLAVVLEAAGVLGDAVEHLVTDDIEQNEGGEDNAITVAVSHLAGVPEGVVVTGAVVHGANQVHAGAVDAVASEDDLQEVAHHAVEVEGVVDDVVAGGSVGLAASLGAGQALGVLGVVDDPLGVLQRFLVADVALLAASPELLGGDQGVEIVDVTSGTGRMKKHVGRNDPLGSTFHDSFLSESVRQLRRLATRAHMCASNRLIAEAAALCVTRFT